MSQSHSLNSNELGVKPMDQESGERHLKVSQFSTMQDVLTQHPERAQVLERWNLPSCCENSSMSLMEMCARTGTDVHCLLLDIHADSQNLLASGCSLSAQEIRALSNEDLVKHWQNLHHAFIRKELPALRYLLEVVVSRHGDEFPRLRQLRTYLQQLDAHLSEGLDDGEGTWLSILSGKIALPGSPKPSLWEVKKSLKEISRNTQWFLTEIKNLTEGFQPPADACPAHRDLVVRLGAFVADIEKLLQEEAAELMPRVEGLSSAKTAEEIPAEA